MGDRTFLPCPGCQTPVPRKDARRFFRRCPDTGAVTCPACRAGGVSLDAFVKNNRSEFVRRYYDDKAAGAPT